MYVRKAYSYVCTSTSRRREEVKVSLSGGNVRHHAHCYHHKKAFLLPMEYRAQGSFIERYDCGGGGGGGRHSRTLHG